MNPIANLPATQNLNRPQQSQGYNRQYFGGDEVDQFELSQEAEEAAAEEQNKKKIWAYAAGIGAAIVAGAAVLLGLRATGHATWAKLGNNENSLTGLTKLSKTQGDTVKKGATLAEGAMKGTLSGGSWNGISTSITGSASQYKNIIFVGKEENYKALTKTITDSAVKIQHMAYETFDKLKDSINTYLNDDKAAIIVDTDLRNAEGGSVYERIKKYWDESNSAGGETKAEAEEKKEEVTTTETDGGTGSVEETEEAKKAREIKEKQENLSKALKADGNTPLEKGQAEIADGTITFNDNADDTKKSKFKITTTTTTKPDGVTIEENQITDDKPMMLIVNNGKKYIAQKDGNTIKYHQMLSQTEFDKAKADEEAKKAAAEKAAAEKAAAEKAAAEKAAAEKTAAVINQPANKNAGVDDLLKVNPQKTAEIPESEQQDNSQTSVVAADEKTKVVDSTTTGTTVDGQQNTNDKPADKPADNPVDSSNANENAADSNPPIATGAATGAPADGQPAATGTTVDGQQNTNDKPADKPADNPVDSSNANENAADSNPPIATGAATGAPADGQPAATGTTGGTSEGGKQTVDEHPVVTPTVQDGGSNPKVDKTKESTPNTTDQSNPSANETKATNPSNPAAKESSDSEVDEVENNTKK